MTKWLIGVLAFVACAGWLPAHADQLNPAYKFIEAYVNQLVENEALREKGSTEISAAISPMDKMVIGIHGSSAIQLKLQEQINELGSIDIPKPSDDVIPLIIKFYARKYEIHDAIVEDTTQMIGGPKPGVDYGPIVARIPKLRATLESIDESLFKLTPLVFGTIVDHRPNVNGKLSRLIITTAERDKLVRDIDQGFGPKLAMQGQSYFVNSGDMLRHYLTNTLKCADER